MRVVNLAHENDPATTPLFPGDPPFSLETVATVKEDVYLKYVRVAEHTERTGPPPVTSMPTPPARSLSPRDLYLPAVVVDARDEAAANPDYEVSISDL